MAVLFATPDAREIKNEESSGQLQQVMSACDPSNIFDMKNTVSPARSRRR